MGKMDGKVAFITGGARGQGRAHALRLAQEGADIIITDICVPIEGVHYPLAAETDLAETEKLVRDMNVRCLSYVADARDAGRMKQVADEAVAELGRLDTVVINHGIGLPHGIDEESLDIWDTVIETNLSSVWRTVVATVPHLKATGPGGSIIVTGSAASVVAIFNNAAYTVAKHGVIGLVKCLAADLAQDWIRVNAVLPTNVNTTLFINEYNASRFCPDKEDPTVEDMKIPAESLNLLPVPWMEPEYVSHAVLFLASDEAKYVTGIAMPVDAGMTIQPPGITPFLGRRMAELKQGID
ncbi:mycofactocin-coupled SDR family oxidoreductase [Gordonia jinghuaiqii]|uniref:Mycofactocin-coupled SDR family oxidoreductase n=1 Tax=Gordonia jinghuaiqii TaxID=2758710 RepID=A0A7D7LWF9_9ACTN|nr:mycofactocin-coupled SDR family oxidoreductase [Gordonia jinghuaiqii]MCR5978013.1 mycofactocin-coupled SDR family oxidoreductase [Gordonia jinghuaiqii]QMT01519.1 mycofactocin-coupled SDR family oxidoreductase [Gordonia jinghuaiqii]